MEKNDIEGEDISLNNHPKKHKKIMISGYRLTDKQRNILKNMGIAENHQEPHSRRGPYTYGYYLLSTDEVKIYHDLCIK